MNQPYFIVVLAHSLHGRLRRFRINQSVIVAVLALAVLGCFTLFGMISSYARMAWKVSNYNDLRQETEFLRARYQRLLNQSNETTEQVARLQMLATEVSLAYGVRGTTPGTPDSMQNQQERLVPSVSETFEEYNMLKTATLSRSGRSINRRWFQNPVPSLWPVNGRLLSHFGRRDDPFSGLQAFHAGVDISASLGTPVRATADGIVEKAEWGGAYGRLIVIDHGGGRSTFYAHLSRIDVIAGQDVRMGQVIGGTGATGRVTSPHLHYEVREGGGPINPYHFLSRSAMMPSTGSRTLGF